MKHLIASLLTLGIGSVALGQGCQAFFTYNVSGQTVHFTDGSTANGNIISWSWTFGDGGQSAQQNPTHTYAQPGSYAVCLLIVDSFNCTGYYCDTIQVGNTVACHSVFTWTHLQGTTYQFHDQSTASGQIVSWLWTWGDGSNPSSQQNPVHTFPFAGTFVVCLEIWTNDSCYDKACFTIHIPNHGCQAAMTYAGWPGPTFQFYDQSTASDSIIGWFWDFGDGHTSTQQHPAHVYQNSGGYLVCLTIFTADSCTSTDCDSIWVGGNTCYDPHVIDTSVVCPTVWQPVCGCDSVTYANSCEAYYHHGITWWTPGPCGSGGCQAAFTVTGGGGPTYQFHDQSTSTHQIVQWHWDFGDGHTSSQQNPFHVYWQNGTYVVCLTIVTADSCTSTTCHTIVVTGNGGGCQAYFTHTNLQTQVVQFNDGSSASGTIVSWYWDFGDGSSSTAQNPVHTYAHPGNYWVCLTIVTSDSCTDHYCKWVHAGNNLCHAQFVVSQQGTFAAFTDQSTGNNIVYWSWTFGDGGSSTLQNPTHNYAHPGLYNVCLTIITADSCIDTWCDSVYIGTGPCPDPSVIDTTMGCTTIYDPVCGCDSTTYFNSCIAYYYFGITQWTHGPCQPAGACQAHFSHQSNGLTVSFTDLSTAGGTIVGWWWDFGDGNGSISQNPVYTYTHAGTYLVCLTIVTADSCYSTWCDTLTVMPSGVDDPNARFGFNISPNPANEDVQLAIELGDATDVVINAFDVSGRNVGSIYQGALSQGSHDLTWNVSALAGGVYFVRLIGNDVDVTKKLMIVR